MSKKKDGKSTEHYEDPFGGRIEVSEFSDLKKRLNNAGFDLERDNESKEMSIIHLDRPNEVVYSYKYFEGIRDVAEELIYLHVMAKMQRKVYNFNKTHMERYNLAASVVHDQCYYENQPVFAIVHSSNLVHMSESIEGLENWWDKNRSLFASALGRGYDNGREHAIKSVREKYPGVDLSDRQFNIGRNIYLTHNAFIGSEEEGNQDENNL